MKQWNPDDARKLTIDSLKIVPSVRQWLSFQKLYPTDLLIVLHNSTARPFRSTYFFYSFRQAISTPGYAIAQAAGLEDVGILMNTRGLGDRRHARLDPAAARLVAHLLVRDPAGDAVVDTARPRPPEPALSVWPGRGLRHPPRRPPAPEQPGALRVAEWPAARGQRRPVATA